CGAWRVWSSRRGSSRGSPARRDHLLGSRPWLDRPNSGPGGGAADEGVVVMRKIVIGLASLAIVGAACAKSSVPVGSASAPTTTAASVDPAACAQGATLHNPGTLTIGTDNPAYPPYFVGNAPKGSVWKL